MNTMLLITLAIASGIVAFLSYELHHIVKQLDAAEDRIDDINSRWYAESTRQDNDIIRYQEMIGAQHDELEWQVEAYRDLLADRDHLQLCHTDLLKDLPLIKVTATSDDLARVQAKAEAEARTSSFVSGVKHVDGHGWSWVEPTDGQ